MSPCLFNLRAEYIIRNGRLDESQTGIKISGRNINNLRYSDDTTLMAESEKELNSLLMRRREESDKADLKCNVKTKNKQKKNNKKKPLRSWHPVPSLHGKWMGKQWKQ